MTTTDIKPGSIVTDTASHVNFGLPVQVIAENTESVMVAFVNLDGNYQETWLPKDQVLPVDVVATKNPALW